MIILLKNANLLLAFLLELGVLAALGYWGFLTGPTLPSKIVLGIGAPIVAIVIWALFGAPTAIWHLYGLWRVLLQIVFFGSAVVALFAAGQPGWGIAFALIYILNYVLVTIWKQ
ncbi:MAG TPA: YrdB family protein [Ktedonosporobacter sp.]|nr:YrdB family protein [Ktedonosporobacter sp.]